MEKRIENSTNRIKRIVLIGPESTGKTTLTQQLAEHYQTVWLPEYAREYVENLNRPYTFDDVEIIARHQVELEKQLKQQANKYFFLDTDLIITKIWFDVVYQNCPKWIIDEIETTPRFLYLLCYPDIEWQPDKSRENGGEMRVTLYNMYKSELESFGLTYKVIIGKGDERLNNCVKLIENFV